jgi:hypothetical protein
LHALRHPALWRRCTGGRWEENLRKSRGEAGGSRRGAASHVDSFVLPIFLAHRTSPISGECPTPFREPLQFIVIAVMSVIRGTFPDTYGVFYVTINSWRVRGPSRHRHDERHRRNALPKRLTRYRDGDDAHDADIRAYSRQRVHLYFLGSLTPQPDPTNPTRRARSPLPMRLSNL